LKYFTSLIVFAAPSPNIITSTIRLALRENGCSDTPHDDAEDVKGDYKGGIVDGNLFRSLMPAFPVAVENDEAREERDAGNRKQHLLRPGLGVGCPGRDFVSGWECPGGVEDCERGGEHSEDDETAREVHSSHDKLCYPHTLLRSLFLMLANVRAVYTLFKTTYQIMCLLLVGVQFGFLQDLFFSEGWAEHGLEVSRCGSRALHGTLESRTLETTAHNPRGWWRQIATFWLLHLDGLVGSFAEIAKPNVCDLRLSFVVVCRRIHKRIGVFRRVDG
jgi:hypothetical protein